ncbi:MAG TPA: GntG family PLP-dependent aldolase [Acidimicrobiales bacterium]|nr:GntG family PLP-dependent aldolase [Acidimicrobiales bacterium]
MLVDLRSDTVTRPTPEMRRAMADAEVGDDEYGEDPTVNRLQDAFAELLGKQAALFVPSGTMANQVALRTLTRPGDAVAVGARQHVVVYEEGAGPINAGVTFLTLDDREGWLAAGAVEEVIESGFHHQPRVKLIAVEDSHMAAGGRVWPEARMGDLAEVADRRRVPVHMDGARLWNAAVATATPPAERAAAATTVMCCLSKGLGAPVGSLLAGPADVIEEARLQRKRLGGTMRQAGVIAAAGLVALGRIDRLAEDHARARALAGAVAERWPDIGADPAAVDTNIVTFSPPDPAALLEHLADGGVRAGTVGPGRVRLVTHADVDEAGIELACRLISKAP